MTTTTGLPVEVTLRMEMHTCIECGVAFGMPTDFVARRREDGRNFFCPNGHPAVFRNTLQKQLDDSRKALADREAALKVERDRVASLRADTQRLQKQLDGYKVPVAAIRKALAARPEASAQEIATELGVPLERVTNTQNGLKSKRKAS